MPRIAVVDDDPSMLALMAEVVRECEWDMLPVQDSDTVNDVARQYRPDAVLFDFHAGVMQPRWEPFRRLKAKPDTSSIPVIIWSSDSGLFADRREWLAQHVIPILTKPFELVDLFAQLELICRHLLQASEGGPAPATP